MSSVHIQATMTTDEQVIKNLGTPSIFQGSLNVFRAKKISWQILQEDLTHRTEKKTAQL
jgi:hypothetical protein